jgi:calpain
LGTGSNDNSEFFMTKEDFFEYFQDVQVVRLSPESLNDRTNKHTGKSKLIKKEFFGSWKIGSTAGGCGDYNDLKYASTFATNPQFLIKFGGSKNQNCPCIVALMQKGQNGLTSSNVGDFLIGFEIFRVDDPEGTKLPLQQKFCQNNATRAISTGAYINKREVLHAYSDMKPGTYVIIPATSKSNQAGDFLLRVFSDKSLIDAKAVQLYIPPENIYNGLGL